MTGRSPLRLAASSLLATSATATTTARTAATAAPALLAAYPAAAPRPPSLGGRAACFQSAAAAGASRRPAPSSSLLRPFVPSRPGQQLPWPGMMPPGSASAAGAIGRGLSTTTAAEARRGAPLSAEEIRSQLLAAGGGGGGEGQRQNRGSWLELGRDVDLALESLARSDCVCFDVDSTVVGEEGIDVLADYLGHGKEVADLTRAAMEGGMKFQDALKLRLDLLRPSLPQIQACLRDRPLRLTPGVQELVSELGASGKDVWLVSGGFRLMIEPVARQLGIPGDRIVANTLRFRPETGEYLDFDPDEPTSADMGKPRALERIRASRGYSCMVMVGDGATDAQAKPPASAFVGFGGVVSREPVRRVADWFVADFAPLAEVARIARGSPPSASAGRTSAQ